MAEDTSETPAAKSPDELALEHETEHDDGQRHQDRGGGQQVDLSGVLSGEGAETERDRLMPGRPPRS